MSLTEEQATARFKKRMKELNDEFGAFRVPSDRLRQVTEEMRAFYVIQKFGSSINPTILSQYMLPPDIAKRVLDEVGIDKEVEPQRKEKRSDKYNKVYQWCAENTYRQVTPLDVAEIGSISYPTALKVIKDRPDLFRTIKRGLYEVRDPKADREADK